MWVASTEFKKKLDECISSYDIKFYIQDNNNKWVDFSTRGSLGRNALLKIGTVSHSSEKDVAGGFVTTIQSILVDNSDGLWDKPFENLSTINNVAASFTSSGYYQRSIVYRHRVKLSMLLCMRDGSVEEGTIGVFLIDEITYKNDGTVEIKLVGLAKKLMERDASKLKNGRSWYTNMPVSFLVKELLKTEFATSSGGLPGTYILPGSIDIDTANSTRALSHYGRPPEWDGTYWRRDGYYTRAICAAQASGDSKTYLYLGCDNNLWRWDAATDTYTYLGAVTAGYYIRRLWYNGNDSCIYGVAYGTPSSTSRTVTLKIFVWNGSSVTTLSPTDSDSSLSKCFPGDFCYREGTYSIGDNMRRIGDTVWGADGENITSMYRQYVNSINTAYTNRDVGDVDIASLFGEPGSSASSDVPKTINADVWKWAFSEGSGDLGGMGFRFTFNQQGAIEFSIQENLIIYAVYDSGTTSYKLYKYDVDTNTCSNISSYPNVAYQPTAMGVGGDGCSLLFIGFMYWLDTGSTTSQVKLYKLDLSSGTWTDRSSIISTNYETILEINADAMSISIDDDLGQAILLNRNDMTYRVVRNFDVGGWVEVAKGRYQYKGMAYGGSGDGYLYMAQLGVGRLCRSSTTSTSFEVLDDSDPFVEGDGFISVNKLTIDVSDSTNHVVYGVSAPYIFIESQELTPEGKYYLWKYSNKRSDRIELADFSDLSAWEALTLLAQIVDYVMGFDVNGDFYFIKRTNYATSDTIELGMIAGLNERLVAVDVNSGESEIYNFCQMTPNVAKLADPSSELVLIQRPTDYYGTGKNSLPFASSSVDQRDLLTKRVKAICTKKGTISDGKVRFKYLIYDSVIETNFRSSVGSSDVTLYLYSVYDGDLDDNGIHIGNFAIVTDKDTGVEIVREVNAVSVSNRTVGIATAFGKAFSANDEIRFIRSNYIDSSYTRSGWSDSGVTYITEATGTDATVAVKSVEDLSEGVIVIIGTDERRILSINPDASPNPTITVDSNFSQSWASGSVVYAWWSPNVNDKYFEIGGSNVFIKFVNPTGGTSGTDWTNEFIEGDYLSVVCGGLSLQQDSHAKVSAYATDSVSKYGKRQYPSVSNRFAYRGIAKDICQRIMNRYKEPAYVIEVESIFLPYVNLVTQAGKLMTVDLVSNLVFRNAPSFKIRCRIRSIEHDPDSCKTVFSLKAVSAY